jgi:hypothetical protein
MAAAPPVQWKPRKVQPNPSASNPNPCLFASSGPKEISRLRCRESPICRPRRGRARRNGAFDYALVQCRACDCAAGAAVAGVSAHLCRMRCSLALLAVESEASSVLRVSCSSACAVPGVTAPGIDLCRPSRPAPIVTAYCSRSSSIRHRC